MPPDEQRVVSGGGPPTVRSWTKRGGAWLAGPGDGGAGAVLRFGAEDNLAMAARLSAAGNDVDLRVYPESMQGFTSHPTLMARAAPDGIETWLPGRLVDGSPGSPVPPSSFAT